jgi:nitroimidazol reductase NimA-like FMN-containing flavoprotein (pyridoxamine 5'-phosphate oxidase superfamily)
MYYTPENIEELSREDIDRVLAKAVFGRLGLAFENEAYVVPVWHRYDGQRIWFRIGKEGKTTTYLQANPQACFEVDELDDRGWRSVICYGTVTLSDSFDSKRELLRLSGTEAPSDEQLEQMKVFVCILTPDEMTGRKSRST